MELEKCERCWGGDDLGKSLVKSLVRGGGYSYKSVRC